ncbi:ABC transporter ATP-binding protein [Halioxenophilus sp. WMMB6]|uniref:ABC transporter ATP-binding protein n=1 Tax=Halioxenophilus sp. WMMB6 TaxID=3073815 RepID=UPI00295F0ED1|nr:polyamine ABC transporter ATP-binding protein [Halioxenophilus sp. WMMB6]
MQATSQIETGTESSATEEAYVKIEKVSKNFDGFLAVNNVSLSIKKGEIFALLGASGCGKSTLLRILAGFEKPSNGEIFLQGQSLNGLEPFQRPINMMFQSYALFPHMTVEQNLAFGLKQDKLSKAEIAHKVNEKLTLVDMEHLRKRKPHQLSGGQQQRVALARSLIKEPKLLLLDEPMGALDKKLRSRMQLEVANIIDKLGVTCVMVTHDQEEAMTMADRIAIMEAGEIRQVGTPDEIYEQPNSRYTAEFIGSVNIFSGVIGEDEPDYVTVITEECEHPILIGHGITCFPGQNVSVAVRPEKVGISKEKPDQEQNAEQGEIKDIAYLGSHSVYHVQLASGKRVLATELNAIRWAGDRLTWGDQVWVYWGDNAGVVLTQ